MLASTSRAFGYFYAAYSHVGLDNAVTVGRAIEVIHASGGGEFGLGVVDNYLGPSCVSTQFGTIASGQGLLSAPVSLKPDGTYAVDTSTAAATAATATAASTRCSPSTSSA